MKIPKPGICGTICLMLVFIVFAGIVFDLERDRENKQKIADMEVTIVALGLELQRTDQMLVKTQVELGEVYEKHEKVKDSVPSMINTIRDLRAELKDCWQETVAYEFDKIEEVN